MSGHSKWANIKHAKGKTDVLRGKIFSKWAREITVAAKQGGGDPDGNPRLRLAIEKARDANMPKDTILRAIQKATGGGEGTQLEEILYEGYGPGGVALLVEVVTDNKNRTSSDIRYIFDRNGGKMGSAGSVAWMFQKKGMVTVTASGVSEDDLLGVAVDAGAEDLQRVGDFFSVVVPVDKIHAVAEALKSKKFPVVRSEISQEPQNTIRLEGDHARQLLKLLQALEDHDDVQNVHGNFDVPDEILQEVSA